jgi:hypothetical protein
MAEDGVSSRSRPPERRRIDDARRELLAHTKEQIASRLRPVCSQMPDDEFEELVTRAAEIEIRYAMRRRDALIGSPHSNRSDGY